MPKCLLHILLVHLLLVITALEAQSQILNERVEEAISKGMDYFDQGNMVEALGQFELAKSIAEEKNLDRDLAEACNWIGNAHNVSGEPAKARDAYRQALSLASNLGDRHLTERLNINLGILSSKMDDHGAAQKHLRQALKFFTQNQDSSYWLLASNSLGYAYLHTYQLDSAKLLLESSLDLASSLEDTVQLAHIYANLGALYFTMDRYDLATSYYEKSIEYYQDLSLTEQTRDLYFDLLKLKKLSNDISAMNQVMGKYFVHFDKVLPRHSTEYEFYQKLKGERAQPEKTSGNSKSLLIAFSGLVIVALTLLIFGYARLRRMKQKAVQLEKEKADLVQKLSTTERIEKEKIIVEALEPIRTFKEGILIRLYYRFANGGQQYVLAMELGIADSTVHNHIKRIQSELNIEDIRKHAVGLGVFTFTLEEFEQLFGLKEFQK